MYVRCSSATIASLISAVVLELAAAMPAHAQWITGQADASQLAIGWAIFILGLVAIVFIFYKPVYGLLINYYSPSYCKEIVLSMMLLWVIGWMATSSFLIFSFGFSYPWLSWVYVSLGGLWIIWFAVVMMRNSAS